MSGSSLDGLDFAVCRFRLAESEDFALAEWEIMAAETDPFPPTWEARLRSAPALPGRELWRLHADFGRWIGRRAADYLGRHPSLRPSLVGSHGHTIFHEPDRGFTTQIGDGAFIARALGLTTVSEFRSGDLAVGGQGAPLAPIADKYLFPQYDGFLNLGGIANLSIKTAEGEYLAGDISGCCQILDRLAAREGLAYDDGGRLSAGGSIAPAFAPKLEALPFHNLPYPKSLGNTWVREALWPIVNDKEIATADCLYSFTVWLSEKIGKDFKQLGEIREVASSRLQVDRLQVAAATEANDEPSKILITGGGARNTFLVNQLRATQNSENPRFNFLTTDPVTGDFKEAALMAICALLRAQGQPNALASATGATQNNINGALYLAS